MLAEGIKLFNPQAGGNCVEGFKAKVERPLNDPGILLRVVAVMIFQKILSLNSASPGDLPFLSQTSQNLLASRLNGA